MHPGSDLAAPASAGWIDVRVRGKRRRIHSVCLDGRTVTASGRWLKIAAIDGEEFVEGETVPDPDSFCARLRHAGLKADIFTFAQKALEETPRYPYPLEWDNAAVTPTTNPSDWLAHCVEYDVRKAIRKAAKIGVVVRQAELDDGFVRGIAEIYNETPVRQGRAFWHYQKDLESVRRENSTYPERSIYIGAYYQDELIGFIRMVVVDAMAATLQVLSMKKHFDKKPTSALLAKAVEICAERRLTHLMYGKYVYTDPASSLTEFKRRNGFRHVRMPKYYIPLTLKGRLALRLRLHREAGEILPRWLVRTLRAVRARIAALRA
jgi:hypothetical protein